MIALATAVLCHRVYIIPTSGKKSSETIGIFIFWLLRHKRLRGRYTHTQFNIEMCFHLFMPGGVAKTSLFSIEKYNRGEYRSKKKNNPRLFPLFFSLSYSAVNGIVNVRSRTYTYVCLTLYIVSPVSLQHGRELRRHVVFFFLIILFHIFLWRVRDFYFSCIESCDVISLSILFWRVWISLEKYKEPAREREIGRMASVTTMSPRTLLKNNENTSPKKWGCCYT